MENKVIVFLNFAIKSDVTDAGNKSGQQNPESLKSDLIAASYSDCHLSLTRSAV